MTSNRIARAMGCAALLVVAGCSESLYDITNTNAPTVEQLTNNPTKATLARAALGSAAQIKGDLGGEIQFFAIFGREGYNLLGNDPRLTSEMLAGPLDARGFGGGNWFGKYQALRTINTYLDAIPKAPDLSAGEKAASVGYAQTLKAVMFHRQILRSGATGIPIAVQVSLSEPPAPFVSQAGTYTYLVALLDSARASLQTAGASAFPFTMPPGFEIANTPATFIRFNRALLAKVQVHRATFSGGGNAAYTAALAALGESFISTTAAMSLGVNYAYSEASGEPNNPITDALDAQRHYLHPSILNGAQLKANNDKDDRATSKSLPAGVPKVLNGLNGAFKPTMYNKADGSPNLGASIPIIKNEELLLLRAEANWFAGSKQAALDDINLVRSVSGGLAATALTTASSNDAFVIELSYNRLYSLLWEQGTRWLDARRFNRLSSLPLDRTGDQVFPNMLVPAGECDARGLDVPCLPPAS